MQLKVCVVWWVADVVTAGTLVRFTFTSCIRPLASKKLFVMIWSGKDTGCVEDAAFELTARSRFPSWSRCVFSSTLNLFFEVSYDMPTAFFCRPGIASLFIPTRKLVSLAYTAASDLRKRKPLPRHLFIHPHRRLVISPTNNRNGNSVLGGLDPDVLIHLASPQPPHAPCRSLLVPCLATPPHPLLAFETVRISYIKPA